VSAPASTGRSETVGIVGAGSFGTALASVVARTGRRVVLWSRDAAVVDQINRERRCARLPGAPLPPPLEATADPKKLAAEARLLVLAVASTDIRVRAKEVGDVIDGSHLIVHAIGAFAAPDDERCSEVIAQATPALRIGVLAGPALPADLVSGGFSSMVVASRFAEVASEARRLLSAPPTLRLYSATDVVGVELASALSGAYTVALGMADALAVGTGARAVLITRALAEASRLGKAAGADPRTFGGLAGLGNVLVRAGATAGEDTRSSDYAHGVAIARGAPVQQTEGTRAALAGVRLAKRFGVRMPLLEALAGVLTGKLAPADAARLAAETVAIEE
jgi:glycerol-3-phosphate dehydrogenase (NAD(P)+)